MIKAVLLDLDNTLLLFDEKLFMTHYLALLAPKFSDVLGSDEFRDALLKATAKLMKNRGPDTNLQVFLGDFSDSIPALSTEIIKKRFASFYTNEFTDIRRICAPNQFIGKLIEKLTKMRGIKLVLATNAVFTRSAIVERVSWAGVDAQIFDLITHCEIMHSCKPRKEYFLEISELIGIQPTSCLMIGNDKINDMVAGHIGMKTYLLLDSPTNKSSNFEVIQQDMINDEETPLPDFCGSMEDLILLLSLIGRCSV